LPWLLVLMGKSIHWTNSWATALSIALQGLRAIPAWTRLGRVGRRWAAVVEKMTGKNKTISRPSLSLLIAGRLRQEVAS